MIEVSQVKALFHDDGTVTDDMIEAVFPLARTAMKIRMGNAAYLEYSQMEDGDQLEELQLAEVCFCIAKLIPTLPSFTLGKILIESTQFGDGKETAKPLDEVIRVAVSQNIKQANEIIDYWLVTKENATDPAFAGSKKLRVAII